MTNLHLWENNNFTEKVFTAFSKLLNDVSSIESTYNSNHTLKYLSLPASTDATIQEMKGHINSAIKINKGNGGNPHAAGRAKVMQTQLNSQKRKELCRLQGIDYSHGSSFADIDPILLPEVLALVGGNHGQRELYRMLMATVPYLASAVNEEAALQERMANNEACIAALTSNHKHDQDALTADYKRKQAALTAEYTRQTALLAAKNLEESIKCERGNQPVKLCGTKRGRSSKVMSGKDWKREIEEAGANV